MKSPQLHRSRSLVVIAMAVCAVIQSIEAAEKETKVERRFRTSDVYDYDKTILYRSDFAETGFDKLNLSEDGRYSLPRATPERIAVVTTPDLKAKKAVRFFVPRAANSYRAEISLPHEKGFQERWYFARMLVPENWQIDTGKGADIVMQWHAIPGNWRATHPNLNIAIQGRNWYVRQHYGAAQDDPVRKNTKLETPLETGKWVDWVVHARWSPRKNGLIEIWKDGKKVFRFAGPNVYSTIGVEYTPYLKTGIYHPEWNLNQPRKRKAFDQEVSPPKGKTIYVSQLTVGSEAASYDDVAP